MASGSIRATKQTTRTKMELESIGARKKTDDPMSVPLATSSPKGELNVTETSLESIERDNPGENQDVKLYSPGFNIPHKNDNAIHPHNGRVKFMACKKGKQKTKTAECWKDPNKDSTALKIAVLFSIVSLTSLVLVVLDVVGIVGFKCVYNNTFENAERQSYHFIQPNASTRMLLKRIDMLERNISSLVLHIQSLQSGGHGNGESNISSGGNGGNSGEDGAGDKDNLSNASLTTTVQKLRENQVQLHSSLTKLKQSDKAKSRDIQEMRAKVIGLAVAVNFLSLNDSLIKSKVHTLSQSEAEFRSSIEALKQKDAEVDATLWGVKGVEAFLNSSVNQLNIRLGQTNTNIMAKIKSMNATISGMQGGGGGGLRGPRGPRGIPGTSGAGNLSQCQHQQKEFTGVSGSTADYFVRFIEPKDMIVVGASCSTVRGDETSLSSGTNSRGEKVYICTCRGESNFSGGSGKQKCLIDVWVCPRIS